MLTRFASRARAAATPLNRAQDGVQRGLVGEVIKRFEQRGYTLRALKVRPDRASSTP